MCIRMSSLTGDSGKGPIVATLLLLSLPHNFVWHTYIFRSFSYTRPEASALSAQPLPHKTEPCVPVPLVFSYIDYTAWLRPERNISYLVVVARSLPAPFLQIHYLPHFFHSFKTPHSTISTITRNQNQPVQVLLPFNSHPTDRSMTWQRMRFFDVALRLFFSEGLADTHRAPSFNSCSYPCGSLPMCALLFHPGPTPAVVEVPWSPLQRTFSLATPSQSIA